LSGQAGIASLYAGFPGQSLHFWLCTSQLALPFVQRALLFVELALLVVELALLFVGIECCQGNQGVHQHSA